MRSFRLTIASWQMLQRLSQPTAVLEFSEDDGRFHFCLHGVILDLVRKSTIDALSAAGLIVRERFDFPSFVINEKGSNALKTRLSKDELAADELPEMRNITVVSCQSDG